MYSYMREVRRDLAYLFTRALASRATRRAVDSAIVWANIIVFVSRTLLSYTWTPG